MDMASTDAPFGLQPWGNVLSANMYSIVTSNAAAFFVGDLVEAVGTALSTPLHGTLQQCIQEEEGAAGSLLGAVLALFDSDGDPVKTIAASTTGNGVIAGYALVADHADQVYVAQEDGDTSSLQAADIGLNIDMVSTQAGDTNTGLSGMELDSDTAATTSTLGLKIVGVHPEDTISSDGSAGTNCRFIVKMNAAHRGSNIDGV